MEDLTPEDAHSGDLDRLRAYGNAVRKMRTGEFHALTAPTEVNDPIDDLGREVVELALWLERRFDEFHMLQELSEKVGTALFADDVLDRIFETFSTLIPYDRIGCALLTDEGRKLRAHWARSQYTKVQLRKGYTEQMAGSSLNALLASGTPRIINDLEAYLAAHPNSRSTRMVVAEGVRSSLTCPLVANGKPLGFLFFSSCEKNTYRDLHNAVFLKIAGQISVLIEKSLLYQELFELNTKLNAAHEQLQRQAKRDALTEVLNRGAIFAALRESLDAQSHVDRMVGVIMADLDHFKLVNDRHGHLAGDAVLHATAQTLEQAVATVFGETGTVGRYGGEEFLVILPDCSKETPHAVAEHVRCAVAQLDVTYEGQRIPLTLSLGCTVAQADEAPEACIARADAALYTAKETGRNRAHFVAS